MHAWVGKGMLFSDNYWPGKRPGIRQSIYGWQTIVCAVISLDPFMHDSICRGLIKFDVTLLHDIKVPPMYVHG